MAKTKIDVKGEEGFDRHYAQIYGESLWPQIKSACQQSRSHVQLAGLTREYHLDRASLLPPRFLNVQPGENVLDMCAAPGGKSLQLALACGGEGRLVLNELSRSRRNRLARVIEEHLSPELRAPISIWNQDGSLLGLKSPDRFDKILLDAPCSSERHLLEHPDELQTWSPKRSKHLAQRQMGLLCSALELLQPGGTLVYSTCSISPLENETNVAKFLKKRKGKVQHLEIDVPPDTAMPLSHGVLVRPDLHGGHGPMYVALLRKTDTL